MHYYTLPMRSIGQLMKKLKILKDIACRLNWILNFELDLYLIELNSNSTKFNSIIGGYCIENLLMWMLG